MTHRLRKLNLTTHVTTSVGWLGSVGAFLVLSIAGQTSSAGAVVRSAYVAMNLVGEYVIVPLSVLSLATGLLVALTTHWGFARYYWVLAKFALTVVAASLLMLHQFIAVAAAARRVMTATGSLPSVGSLGAKLTFDAALGIGVLLLTTVLSIYKPWGRTAYGHDRPALGVPTVTTATIPARRRDKVALTVIVGLLIGVVVLHLMGRGLGHQVH
jgi:hypothetical protein